MCDDIRTLLQAFTDARRPLEAEIERLTQNRDLAWANATNEAIDTCFHSDTRKPMSEYSAEWASGYNECRRDCLAALEAMKGEVCSK